MAANVDATAQLRFMATVRRQSAPPRCNPFVIVLQVGTYTEMCIYFWATVCKTVRPMLSDRCLSCLSVTLVFVANGWMDQDETWLAGRPRPWPHCVR